jgi:hydrogenase nickel incorporation protein HypA/HybF
MHELSIAQDILEIVHNNVPNDRLSDVRSVVTKLGTFSGVVADSLEFSYQAITADTELEKSFLVFERIPFVILCGDCGNESENREGIAQCSLCGSLNTKICSGTELQVKEIELEDKNEEQQ